MVHLKSIFYVRYELRFRVFFFFFFLFPKYRYPIVPEPFVEKTFLSNRIALGLMLTIRGLDRYESVFGLSSAPLVCLSVLMSGLQCL